MAALKAIFCSSSRSAILSALLAVFSAGYSVHVNRWGSGCFRWYLSEFHHLIHLRYGHFGSSSHCSVEVSGRSLINQIPPSVCFMRPHKGKICPYRMLQKVCLTVERSALFAFRNDRACACGCVEGRDSRLGGSYSLSQRALRHQFHLHLTLG